MKRCEESRQQIGWADEHVDGKSSLNDVLITMNATQLKLGIDEAKVAKGIDIRQFKRAHEVRLFVAQY